LKAHLVKEIVTSTLSNITLFPDLQQTECRKRYSYLIHNMTHHNRHQNHPSTIFLSIKHA